MALLAFCWLAALALTLEFQSSNASPINFDFAQSKQLRFSQNAIAPAAESNISAVSYSFQQITSKDFSSQLVAALLGYNRKTSNRFSRQHCLLHVALIKYRKSDLLFPSHYFW